MQHHNTLKLALVAAVVMCPVTAEPANAQDVVPAHTHIRHVAEAFRGTPDGRGLLPTAMAEAEIAAQHAALAQRDPSDLEAMKRHAGHVMHALEPREIEGGPGLGYGMIRAARRSAHWVELAMASAGAGEAVGTHGPHVTTAAQSAATMAEEALEVARGIREAEAAENAAPLVAELSALTEGALNGIDADGDGRTGWQEGEGGLAQAQQHLELLLRGEGIIG
jgi:hypothetical protein